MSLVQTNTYLFAKLFQLHTELHNFDFLITDLLLITKCYHCVSKKQKQNQNKTKENNNNNIITHQIF